MSSSQKLLLLGDEAIAQGAIDAGLSGCYAYPGTPSTEIMEYVQHSKVAQEQNIHRQWSANEKTALEAAIGMSYAGKRAIACMKHVGLNVAADAFMNSAITGANGGLIIVSADDPSMHSSQNEQDSRYYGKFAQMPIFEPSNQQEAYDMVSYAFDFSEKYEVPVLFRITTRLAHSRSGVKLKERRPQNNIKLPINKTQFVLLPSIARQQYKKLLEKQKSFIKEAESSGFTNYLEGEDNSLGIIACGLAYNYLIELFEDQKCPHPVLKITQYPMPRSLVEKMAAECDEILVLEDGYPLIEELIKGYLDTGKKIRGRLDGSLPRDGELNSNLIANILGIDQGMRNTVPKMLAGRPPQFCDGCGHIDAYKALNAAIKEFTPGRVMADIGCYTLGAYPPHNAINSCVDMGASITMAKGLSDAGERPAIGVIGDSTFTHSGMTGLLDCVNENTPVTIFILDNSTTGMTGGQTSSGFGKIEHICIGLGVNEDHIKVIKPLKKYHEENVETIKKELDYEGVSVIIPRRECVQTLNRRMRQKFSEKKAKENK